MGFGVKTTCFGVEFRVKNAQFWGGIGVKILSFGAQFWGGIWGKNSQFWGGIWG